MQKIIILLISVAFGCVVWSLPVAVSEESKSSAPMPADKIKETTVTTKNTETIKTTEKDPSASDKKEPNDTAAASGDATKKPELQPRCFCDYYDDYEYDSSYEYDLSYEYYYSY